MLEIYCDSSYDWNKTVNGTGTGDIIVVIPSQAKIWREKFTISVPGLKQLNNRFELAAIEFAVKKAGKRKNFVVYSDSQVAVGWANHSKIRWISRDRNMAGKVFDDEKLHKSYQQGLSSQNRLK